MTLEENKKRYNIDTKYHYLVHSLINAIKQCGFTPQEIRDAAFLASEMEYKSVIF